MSQYDSRLFKVGRLKRIAEVCDDISEQCGLITDALSAYEQADDEEDPVECREMAREDAWQALGELLTGADELREIRTKIGEADEAARLDADETA